MQLCVSQFTPAQANTFSRYKYKKAGRKKARP
jgi:hypothetical protein